MRFMRSSIYRKGKCLPPDGILLAFFQERGINLTISSAPMKLAYYTTDTFIQV